MSVIDSCPCLSDKDYSNCCGLYHQGVPCETALELMKSRYSAYVKHNYHYIIATTHPLNPDYNPNFEQWEQQIKESCSHTLFKKLEILKYQKLNEISEKVTFIVYFKKEGQEMLFQEESEFKKENKKWFYLKGIIK